MTIQILPGFISAIADDAVEFDNGMLTPSRHNLPSKLSGLTAGQIPYPSSATALTDSAGFAWNDDITAGKGLYLAPSTAVTDVAAFSIVRTNNNAAVATGVKWTFTDTTSAATFKPFQILGGAAGTTNLLNLDKAGQLVVPVGSKTAPNFNGGAANTGLYATSSFVAGISLNGGSYLEVRSGAIATVSGNAIGWNNTASDAAASLDSSLCRGGVTNSVIFAGGGAGSGTVTSRAEINKAVTAFTDGVAKTVFTLTIPNAAHSASYLVRITGAIGAGGAIGADEASATNCYVVTITRTAGVNAVAGISAAFGAATAAVAGATTVTCTGALAAVSGAVGATNTIDIQATITKGGGASDNHTCVATASLLNANATGITIA